MDIRKAMRIRDVANSDVKLTKAGEKYSQADEKEIEVFLKKASNIDKLNLNELLGISVNPLLTSTQIRTIFKLLKDHNQMEKDKGIKGATRTKNTGFRGKIRKQLALHSNLDSDAITPLMYGQRLGTPAVLNNPNITKENLDDYFEKKIMTTAQGDGYNFVSFKELMTTKNITSEIALGWYKRLKKYADWEFKDNNWYAIIDAYLEYEDCPFEILKDVMELTTTKGQDDFFNRPLRYRKAVVEHPNSTDDLKAIAYEKTQLEEFLPQAAKDLFLF
jgi:hypothetical protein